MAANTSAYGPSTDLLRTWTPRYYPTAESVQSIQNSRRAQTTGKAVGALYSSPLAFGSADEYHDVNLDWFKVVREDKYKRPGTYPTFLADYADPWTDNPYPYLYRQGVTATDYSQQERERNVKIHTFAGQVDGLTIKSNYRKSNAPTRKTANDLSKTILPWVVSTINGGNSYGDGLFAPLIPGAPNGFLISESYDYDAPFYGEPLGDGARGEFLRPRYWPDRLGDNHPLRDLYEKFYGTGARFWRNGTDLAGTPISSGSSLGFNNPLQPPSSKQVHDYSRRHDPVVVVGGPFSETSFKFGNGNNIIAASPVMTAAFHRSIRSRTDPTGRSPVDDFHTNTVLYPSSVGQYGTNTLQLGDGNNIVYYDSSFSDINAGKGNNIFIPSFGSFNWGINWIPAYGTAMTRGSEANPWGSTAKLNPDWLIKDKTAGVITPIPWDRTVINPVSGDTSTRSYLSANNKFAANPKREDISNLYTISSYRRQPLQSTSLNYELLNDKSEETALKTYNPVNKLGGTVIAAKGGNNTFYGQDWSFWQHLLPNTGVTTANQQADSNNPRAVQHQWNTMTLIGGRGNNTFNLGNVVDNITNNGLFLKGDASYRLSLSHDDVYTSEEIKQFGSNFGNSFDPVSGQPLMSVVNLQLQADAPATLTVTLEDANPGQPGSTAAQRAAAWGGVANAANKFVGNGAKIQEDIQKNWRDKIPDPKDPNNKISRPSWLATSKTLARIVGSAIPFVDTAIGIVSAVAGLINLFSVKPAQPPKQEIKATYLSQNSDPATKAILINDWNPHAKININLPSVKASEWKALTFEIKKPISESTRNTDKGAYLNLNKSSVAETNSGATIQTNFPLVVLENLDKNNGFGYYSYNFNNSDNAGYNFVSSDNLRLFGQLPNPSNLVGEDGKTALNPILFPKQFRDGSNYVYKSEDNFDMRHDAASYSSFYNEAGKETGNGFYSRYYFNANSIMPNRMPTDWSIEGNLREFTSNISLEFDSRTLGWYWQPVLKTAADKTEAFNPEQQNLDLERSKLWIKDRNTSTWNASSYLELSYITKAYQNSLKANTFYISTINGEGSQELEKRRQRDQQLDLLDNIMPDLRTLDQSLVLDERSRLHLLGQIKTVSSQKFRAEGKKRDGLLITFTSIDETDNETQKQLLLYKNDSGSVKAKVPLESATALMKLPEPGQSGFALQREPLMAFASTPVVDIDQAQPWRSLGSGPSAQPWGNPPESSGLG